jgi:hypothetical protein
MKYRTQATLLKSMDNFGFIFNVQSVENKAPPFFDIFF